MTSVVNINDVLDGHVGLDLACIDRLYLNAYVPNLQVSGQVVTFLTAHLGFPIPSPALLQKIGNRFRRDVKAFAAEHDIPILQLKKPDRTRWDDRKLDHVRPYLEAAEAEGRFGVVAIVAAQEFAWVFSAKNRSSTPGVVSFDFVKEDRRVGMYYFYVLDPEFGPGFIKICTYFPYPSRVWVNGHEWAKRQAAPGTVGFSELANGFASCGDPARLQAICDRFGPARCPGLLRPLDRGDPHPLHRGRPGGRLLLGALHAPGRGVAAPWSSTTHAGPGGSSSPWSKTTSASGARSRSDAVFDAQIRTGGPHRTKGPFRTRVFSPGTEVKMDFSYKHSRVKQYLKEGRALRIETVINKPADIGILARLEHLPELVERARAVNDRLLMIERAGQGCAIGSALFERIHQPYVREGQRTGALRFGDQRAMALAGALCLVVHAVTGFTNKSLRGHVAGLLGRDYSSSQMSYDLRRLRLHGLIERAPGTNSYALTPEGHPRRRLLHQSRVLACSDHSSTPTNLPHLSSSATPSAPSSMSSATTSATLDSGSQLETCHKIQRPADQEDLGARGDLKKRWQRQVGSVSWIQATPGQVEPRG